MGAPVGIPCNLQNASNGLINFVKNEKRAGKTEWQHGKLKVSNAISAKMPRKCQKFPMIRKNIHMVVSGF